MSVILLPKYNILSELLDNLDKFLALDELVVLIRFWLGSVFEEELSDSIDSEFDGSETLNLTCFDSIFERFP